MTEPHYTDDTVTVYAGDCLDVLAELPAASIDAVVTDPPYGLGFMGHQWDQPGEYGAIRGNGVRQPMHPRDRESGRTNTAAAVGSYDLSQPANVRFGAWCEQWAAECLRILKPGGHMLAFGGTRTWHRLTVAIEDAGFEIRDSIAWLYGSGFPKSLDVSKAIDKAAGAEREVVGYDAAKARPNKVKYAKLPEGEASPGALAGVQDNGATLTAPATDAARRWAGWGTALKPAHEPIVVARKPLTGTVANNVLQHGTGALNIDGCRIAMRDGDEVKWNTTHTPGAGKADGWQRPWMDDTDEINRRNSEAVDKANAAGRWPANVVLDDTQAAALDKQSGESASVGGSRGAGGQYGTYNSIIGAQPDVKPGYGDTGGASRFFYTAKADAAERITHNGTAHPTVKPLDLMRWLVRLVTPPGGIVLDPFAGSGTTAEACILERLRCIAIEREPDYLPLITQRINRRRDPTEYIRNSGEDPGLFGLDNTPEQP